MNEQRIYTELVGDLHEAYRQARRHKAGTGSCVRCMMEIEEELDALARSILSGCYEMRPSICFFVGTPVIREVIAADFRDRIVHHYIFAYLNPHLERELIDDCYSCREGKGTGYGVDRLEHHIRSCSHNYTRQAWALQLDISGYFMSIDRRRLLAMAMSLMGRIAAKRDDSGRRLGSLPRHRLVEELLQKVILYNPLENCEVRDWQGLFARLPRSKSLRYAPEGIGLPIGNLTSQMFSNLYMNAFDQWVKRSLKVRYYGRYVDDTFYLSTDREWLLGLIPQIDRFLKTELSLSLNLKKTRLTEVGKGVTFLGIHLKPFRRYVKSDSLRRMRRRARDMAAIPEAHLSQKAVRRRLLSQANSMLGILGHTRSFRIRCSLFGNYPMYTIAYGMGDMRQFRLMKGARKGRYDKFKVNKKHTRQ